MGLFGTKEEREKRRQEKMTEGKALLKKAVYETLLKEDRSYSAGRLALVMRKDVTLELMQEALDSLVEEGFAIIDGVDKHNQPTYRKVRR